MKEGKRAIPSVEKVLQALGASLLPRPLVTAIVRGHLSILRERGEVPDEKETIEAIGGELRKIERSRIQPVINGTGIVIHTNLGRAPLSKTVVEATQQIGAAYNNLEFDLSSGERGSRAGYLEQLLALICQSEAATVVNNCAAALVLILRHFTRTKPEVVISRGELVQIGGGFRIPEILESSGAKLREIGATNKTGIEDYRRAIGESTGLILKVHRSNFYMAGFVESPATQEISALARKSKIPFVEDLGSGAVIPTEKLNTLPHEPTPAEVLAHGVDLVCFSGDKLFGGPQAGVIAGRKDLIGALKRDPLFRALRCDKLIFAGLQAAAEAYLDVKGSDLPAVPVVQLLSASFESLRTRAEHLLAQIKNPALKVTVGKGKAQAGGGTLPQAEIDSVTLDIFPKKASLEQLAQILRFRTPPIIGYIADQKFKLDLRTIFPEQEDLVVEALSQISPQVPSVSPRLE